MMVTQVIEVPEGMEKSEWRYLEDISIRED